MCLFGHSSIGVISCHCLILWYLRSSMILDLWRCTYLQSSCMRALSMTIWRHSFSKVPRPNGLRVSAAP